MATGGAAMGIGAENSVPCAGTGPVFVPRLHGDVIVSLCEVSSVDLNPAVRLDLAVARCPALVDYGTAAAGLSRSSLEYIVREQMLAENTRNEATLCLDAIGTQVGDGGEADATASALEVLADPERVLAEAARLRVTVGTFVSAVLREQCGSAWETAFSRVFSALSTPTTLHTAIEQGDYAQARTLLEAHPAWHRWKHRGWLPLHVACRREANWMTEDETGEMHELPISVRAARVALIQSLIALDPSSVSVRTDSNWSLGVANGLTAMELAVALPESALPDDPIPLVDHQLVEVLMAAQKTPSTLASNDPKKLPCTPLPAHGSDLEPLEFQQRLSDAVLCDLLHIRFFEEFAPDEQKLLFRLAALVRGTDCINTPSRTDAERQTAVKGEGVVEKFLSALRLQFTTEAESKALADELKMAYVVTPDALFESALRVPGVPMVISWVDSKNGWCVPRLSIPGKLASLRRQVLKYAYHLGSGLVLWHKGYFESVLDVSPDCVFHASITRSSDGTPVVVNCRPGTGKYTKLAVTIPTKRVGLLIGRGGETIKAIEAEHSVLVVVPTDSTSNTLGQTTVHIVGCSVAAARSAQNYIRDVLFRRGGTQKTGAARRRCVEEPTPTAMHPPQLARRGHSLPTTVP
eukprot:m.87531 g.87531  ORF g.87531 m.87531 type:complete len:636 (+) comp11565_c0_seq2:89-1996(+)